MIKLLGLFFGLIAVLLFSGPAMAINSVNCLYGSTQARVQRDANDPWVEVRTIKLGESFNVGSFHNHTGQFAHDTILRVDGPDGFFSNYHNGDRAVPAKAGKYVLTVTTAGQSGDGCRQEAVVLVDSNNNWSGGCVVNSQSGVYRRNGWRKSDVKAKQGKGVYNRDGWWNSDGQAEYGKGIFNRNSWWGE